MNMEESERLLEIKDRIESLAAQIDEHPSIAELVNHMAQDMNWLIDRLRYHEKEKNSYREELQLVLDGTHAEP